MASVVDYWDDYEVLTIETPEMLQLRLPLAGFGPRALAWVIDSFITGIVLTLLILIAVFGFWDSAFSSGPATGAFTIFLVVVVLIAMLSPVFYFVVFESLWNGQTPGKRWLGIRVVRRGGLPLTFTQVLVRNLLRVIDLLPSNGMIGFASFFMTRLQQRLGDLAADTVVIREFQAGKQPFLWAGTPEALSVRPQVPGALTPALAYAAGSYLARAAQFEQSTRLRLTEEMIRRLGYGASTLSLREREDYLASILYQRQAGHA